MDFSRLTDPQAYKDALAGLLRRGTEVGEYIEQAPTKVGQSIMDAGQRQSALMNKAFDPTGNKLIRDPQSANQAAMNLFEGPMSFASMGMTKLIDPQTKAFKTAQKNAALPVEKGGLGLAPDNTQWQRAEAMGFNVREPMYHGTKKEFTEFDLSKHGSATDKGDFGKAVYVTTDPDIAKVYAIDSQTSNQGSQILPLLIKEGKQYKVKGQQGMNELIQKLGGEDKWFDLTNNPEAYAKSIKDLGFNSVRDRGYAQTAVYDPTSIRSKFAAFDPKKVNSPDLLAGAIPLGAVSQTEEGKQTRKELLEQLLNNQK
jgi:hypothetical protein